MRASIHRPTQIQVDLQAISYNVEQVVSHLPHSSKVFAVVKANAYGHGAAAVAKTLVEQVDGFCVSNIDEALELRQIGIQQDILVLGVVPVSAVSLAKEENILLTVASAEWLNQVDEQDLSGLRAHIKVDSGMGRIGFRDSLAVNHAIEFLENNGALVEGIFTHFATADEKDETQFNEQLETFKNCLSELKKQPPLVHASNSATSIWHSETIFNMVRLGDIIYGLNPSGHELDLPYPVVPALRLVSEIVHIKQVPAGSLIGYGGTYESSADEYIATIPIGYADGYTRAMQGFRVLVDGKECPVVGRVSMDQTTIRLPQSYPLGTEVVLIGQSGQKEISAQDWADYIGTINYEVVCLLSDRIPRFYED